MDTLSLEIFYNLVSNISEPCCLRSLRAVNRSFRDLVTPLAFRSLTVVSTSRTKESAYGFVKLQKSSIAPYVEKITVKQEGSIERTSPFRVNRETCRGCEECFTPKFAESLSDLSGFISLKSLNFEFFWLGNLEHFVKAPEFERNIEFQVAVLGSIARSSPSPTLKHLSINGLSFFGPEQWRDQSDSDSFKKFFSQLTSMNILVQDRKDLDFNPSAYADFNYFWREAFSRDFLAPAQKTLRSLSIHSLKEIPFVPYATPYTTPHFTSSSGPPMLFFPQLTFLSLKGVVFNNTYYEVHVDEFILKHHDTLRELRLESCAIDWREQPKDNNHRVRWSTIWTSIRNEMKQLVRLKVPQFPYEGDTLGPFALSRHRYVAWLLTDYIHGTRASPVVPGQEDDGPAFERLWDTVEERRKI